MMCLNHAVAVLVRSRAGVRSGEFPRFDRTKNSSSGTDFIRVVLFVFAVSCFTFFSLFVFACDNATLTAFVICLVCDLSFFRMVEFKTATSGYFLGLLQFFVGICTTTDGRGFSFEFPCTIAFHTFTGIPPGFISVTVGFFFGLYVRAGSTFTRLCSSTFFTLVHVAKLVQFAFAKCVQRFCESTQVTNFFGWRGLFVDHGRFLSRLHPSQSSLAKKDQLGWSRDYQVSRQTQNNCIKNNFISQAFYALHITERYAIPVYRH